MPIIPEPGPIPRIMPCMNPWPASCENDLNANVPTPTASANAAVITISLLRGFIEDVLCCFPDGTPRRTHG
jgi:hypothetical protein